MVGLVISRFGVTGSFIIPGDRVAARLADLKAGKPLSGFPTPTANPRPRAHAGSDSVRTGKFSHSEASRPDRPMRGRRGRMAPPGADATSLRSSSPIFRELNHAQSAKRAGSSWVRRNRDGRFSAGTGGDGGRRSLFRHKWLRTQNGWRGSSSPIRSGKRSSMPSSSRERTWNMFDRSKLDNSLLPGLRFAPLASPASLPDPRGYEVKTSPATGPPIRFHGLTPTRIWRSVRFGSSGNCCAVERFRRWN